MGNVLCIQVIYEKDSVTTFSSLEANLLSICPRGHHRKLANLSFECHKYTCGSGGRLPRIPNYGTRWK